MNNLFVGLSACRKTEEREVWHVLRLESGL